MTRTRYQETLAILRNSIIQMGKLSQNAIHNSIEALKDLDIELAESVIEGDQVIDDYELRIEKCVAQLISLQSPTAGDMRLVTSCLKIAIDLERMSDLAVDIAQSTKKIEGEHIKPLIDIPHMAETAESMLEQVMRAFEDNNVTLAESVAKLDDEIDRKFYEVWKELISMMVQDDTTINNASHLLFVIRYLERIGDHACNVCESVVYIASGKREDLN
ncbi:phosphate signaling complex protein PhoU [Methanolobus mangrovi]|uniref:Phosphate-specific transport system accessory protein PhoU n=1 Tax=Methanolobus mangrovi TaxID=3072977 RepID=A0AA51YG30_9EURY|nr:phosphate signaling complex protein PhoU [Methanolobus mangrovi]WMW21512.1 phosphate signaling complex protein PhoU [Methanolobus mangrovi]